MDSEKVEAALQRCLLTDEEMTMEAADGKFSSLVKRWQLETQGEGKTEVVICNFYFR